MKQTKSSLPLGPSSDCLAGGGEMGALMREFDWASTPVGAVDTWPQSLRTAVSILLSTRHPMFIWWGKELVQFYNDGYRPILGAHKHPRALGQSGRECWDEIWHIIGPQIEGVTERGQETWHVDQLVPFDRNGYLEEIYFTYSYSPIRDESGAVGGVLVVCNETTERVLSERRLRTLRDLASRAGTAKDPDDALRLAAKTLEDNSHDFPFALFYTIDRSAEEARLVATAGVEPGGAASPERIDLAEENASPWPLARVDAQGEPRLVDDLAGRFGELPGGAWPESPTSAMLLPIRVPGQRQADAFLVSAVNARKAIDDEYRTFFALVTANVANAVAGALAYEAERKRAEALAELDRAKTVFFSNVSHEFRTPLSLILGPLEDLLQSNGLSDATQESLATIQRNGRRLLKLVNTLLDFSRIEAGRMEAVYRPTDLAELTADLASGFRSTIERAGIRFRVKSASLPAPVYVDRDMWEKIVLNLLSNAFKYTTEGEIEVALEPAPSQPAVELRVRDTGTGIPSEALPHLFERFHRVAGARARTHEGTGIGLALVSELVKLHGGEVSVESEPGEGSVFRVTIPLGTEHLPPERIEERPERESSDNGSGLYVTEAERWASDGDDAREVEREGERGREWARVLLADDNADMRDYLRRLLVPEYEVVTAADGSSALELAREHPPDLVLADVMMPGLDGFGLLRALRSHPRTQMTPIILVSARAGEESRVEGLEAGADDYLVKPFGTRELQARVRTQIELARLRRFKERSVEEAQKRFRLAAEVASDLFYERDVTGGEMAWFGDIDEALGYRRGEFPRTHDAWTSAIHPDDRRRVAEAIDNALAAGASHELHYRVVQRDGSIRHWTERGAPLESPTGAPKWIGATIDVTEWREKEERLGRQALEAKLLHQATMLAGETDSFEAALQSCLDIVCELTAWPLGHAYVPCDDHQRLVSSGIWHLEDPQAFARFRHATTQADFVRGAGLPGRIWASGRPVWIANVDRDPDFTRSKVSRDLGVKSAFGFPVRVGSDTVAVLEFFSREETEPDPQLLVAVRTVGEQMGRVLERKRAQEAIDEQRRTLETINQINLALAAELNRDTLVQKVTDAGRALTGAQFGALFHNAVNDDGEMYMLYSLSGAPREAFAKFPMPRLTEVFAPTFRGEGIIRSDDITKDPRYGRNAPYRGMPPGHLPVRSYLAVPVVSRSGKVLAGLFFGHERPRVFNEKAERIVSGIATQAAIALDNAELYEAAQREIAERKRAQEQLKELNESLERRIGERTRSLVRYQSELRNLASQLTLTEQRERRRLASELHDYLAQLLAVCKMKSADLEESIEDADAVKVRGELDEILDEAIAYTRTLMAKLSPTILYDSGLLAAVRWLANHLKERHGLITEVEVDGDIPDMNEDEAVLVYQTIRELLTNVVKHSRVQQASVLLRPLGDGPDELVVRVEDRGAGFDPGHRKKPGPDGGYGLFSIGERLETMGGRFTIEASPGRGTTAEISVPVHPEPPKSIAPPPRLTAAAPIVATETSGSAANPVRVLIADDHEMVREGLRSLIESCGDLVVVAEAADGEQAVELTRTVRPDIVVMDVNMPRLNGLDATRQIHRELPEIGVVGLSIHGDEATNSLMRQAGAIEYLTKGGSTRELCHAIRRAAHRQADAQRS